MSPDEERDFYINDCDAANNQEAEPQEYIFYTPEERAQLEEKRRIEAIPDES